VLDFRAVIHHHPRMKSRKIMKILTSLFLALAPISLIACGSASDKKQNESSTAPDKASIEAPDQQGKTALMRAIEAGNTAEARRLIEAGANINAKTQSGVCPLMSAAGAGNKEIVELLIQKGADVNARTPGNYTVLMQAALVGQTEIVKILLDAGADPTVKDTSGRTASDWAREKDHNDIVALLNEKSHS
jgi:ankyrin repeat protein